MRVRCRNCALHQTWGKGCPWASVGTTQIFITDVEARAAAHPASCPPCRFVCREALGEGGREAAAYLRPVPPGSLVYGSGDSAVVVTKASVGDSEQASRIDCPPCQLVQLRRLTCMQAELPPVSLSRGRPVRVTAATTHHLHTHTRPPPPTPQAQAAQLYRMNMAQYRQLKAQLVAATAVLVGLGSGMAYAAGGRDLALPFALGGASGVLYQYMLQVGGARPVG